MLQTKTLRGQANQAGTIAALVASIAFGAGAAVAQDPGDATGLPSFASAEISGPAATEKKRVAYQKYVVGACPGTAKQCAAAVLAVRGKRQFEVTSVSCLAQVAHPAAGADIWLINKRANGTTVYDFYQPVVTQETDTVDNYSVNAQTLFVAKAGDRLSVQIASQTNVSLLYCKIAGDMVTYK